MSVLAGRSGSTRWHVGDALKAAEVLTQHWPKRAWRGPKYYAALRACRDVLTGNAAPETAREIFIEAAEEADVLAM